MNPEHFRMEIFMGPKMKDIHRQLSNYSRNYTYNFMDLGVNYCNPEKFANENSIQNLLENSGAIFDSYCLNIEVTNKENLTDAINLLKTNHKRVMITLTSLLTEAEKSGIPENLLIRNKDLTTLMGVDNMNQPVAYFDFITKSAEIAKLLASEMFETLQVDGYYISPNFLLDNTETTKVISKNNTFCPENLEASSMNLIPLDSILTDNSTLLNSINRYPIKQIEVFQELLPSKLLIADSFRESTTSGILIKSNELNWVEFRRAVHESVYYSTVGLSCFGTKICGENVTPIPEDLCVRWYQFSVFVPLFYYESNKISTRFSGSANRIITNAVKM